MVDCFNSELDLRNNERWYVVYCQPHKEAIASLNLNNQGFRTFLPCILKTRRHARKIEKVKASFFPRYMFLILNLDRDCWRSVNGTFGVSHLVMAGDRPQPVTTDIIEHLITCSDDNGVLDFSSDARLRPGQMVELARGPFANQIGVIERLDGSQRVRLLLDLMDSKIPVVVYNHDVMPAA